MKFIKNTRKLIQNPYFHLKQFIADYINCQIKFEELNSPEFHKNYIYKSLELVNTRTITQIDHQFSPYGYTLLMVLADSSLILHSWPEEKFVTIEIFTCGKRSEPKRGLKYLKTIYKPSKFKLYKVRRSFT